MQITFYGQSTFVIKLGEQVLMFDPFITGNPLVNDKDLSKFNPSHLLLSHGHQDHILDAAAIAKSSGATIIANYEVATHFGNAGHQHHPLNHGGKYNFDFGTVKCVNAIHTSSFPDGSYAGAAAGFVVWNSEQCFYFAGDTALTMDMKLIPLTCPKLDFAILPIGDNFTMGYEDAAIAAEFIECDRIIGCHYDTFGYIEIDKEKAIKTFEAKGKELILMDIGQSIIL